MIKTGRVRYKFIPRDKITRKDWQRIFSYNVDVSNGVVQENTEGFIWHTKSDLQAIFNEVYNRYRNLNGFSVRWLSSDGNDNTNTASYSNPALTLGRIRNIVGSNPTIVLVKDTSPDRYSYTYNVSNNTTFDWSNLVFFGGRFKSNLECVSAEKPVLKFNRTNTCSISVVLWELHNVKIVWNGWGSTHIVSTSSGIQHFNTLFTTLFRAYAGNDSLEIQNNRWTLFHGIRATDGPMSFNDHIFSGDRKGGMSLYAYYSAEVRDLRNKLVWGGMSGDYYYLRDEMLNRLLASFPGIDVFNISLLASGGWRVVNAEVSNSVILRRIGLIEDFVNEYRVGVKRYYDNEKITFLNGYWLVDRDDDYQWLLNKGLSDISQDSLYDISENLVLLLERYDGQRDIALLYNQNIYNTVWNRHDVLASVSGWTVKKVFQVWALQENVEAVRYSDSSYEMTLVFRNLDNEIIDKTRALFT